MQQKSKRIHQPIKMHLLYMAKNQFEQCWRGSKLGHRYVPVNHSRDDIDGLKKPHDFDISP